MSTLPFAQVLDALRGNPLEGPIPVARIVGKLVTVRPSDRAQVVLTLTGMAAGHDAPTTTAREIDLALDAMPANALGLAFHLAAAFQTSPPDLALIPRALQKMSMLLEAAIGAPIPVATLFDATVLEALRTCGAEWGPDRLIAGDRKRAEELCRRVLDAVRVSIETKDGVETAKVSRAQLRSLDSREEAAQTRAATIEKALRASLPEP